MAGIQVPPDSTGKIVDTVTLSDAGSEVHRQKVVIAGASGTAEVVAVAMSAPAASAVGMVVRQAGTVDAAIAGTVTIAGNVNLSATANVAIRSIFVATANPSASRGPRCVIVSTSANATLVAAPGAGFAVYITQVNVTNASGTNTRARIGTSASIGQVTMMMAQSGGGFVAQYCPPWRISTNEALVGSVKPNVSEGIFNVHFFVASADAF